MNWPEVRVWRKGARQKLLAARAAMTTAVREDLSRRLIEQLKPVLKDRPAPISFYWPIKAEPDLKPLMRELDAAGIAVCLPVCVKLGEPLTFRHWTQGAKMERGFWDIPVPADPTEVEPRTLIAPIVGYDGAGYRLGYGGGFFDRTLAKLGAAKPGAAVAAIGVGFSMFRLASIQPQPHDIAMAAIVTEIGALTPEAAPASKVCYLDEADAAYAGFATPAEITAALGCLRGALAPERQALIDYALWQVGVEAPPSPDGGAPEAILAALLPRVRDDALHATLAALLATLKTA
ncbi:5-formyltetrahydrofolate cyclo-ligase [Dongia sp.]|uniref:5-formyltetrahydrofolate cyclo-ligase n=1 Tax=Dongia sp. TaxID=1977262 RepID=UPI0037511F0B